VSIVATWLSALPAILALALVAWAISTVRRNAGLVDIFWPLFFLLGTAMYAATADQTGLRARIVIALVAVWAVRLATYLLARNWDAPEDRRYVAIRQRNEPGFAWKSLYLVFGLQGVLAWLISVPLAAAIAAPGAPGALDLVGIAVVVAGIAIEATADAQLARFKAESSNRNAVMDRGLWRYTRHPNYFGECLVWWGFYLIAVAGGGWWTLCAPLLMTVLLLRVSGVVLLEKDIARRRPAYRDYVSRTNAFIPGPPRNAQCGR
jgi:steroid 5-alpha reductase family enzyme